MSFGAERDVGYQFELSLETDREIVPNIGEFASIPKMSKVSLVEFFNPFSEFALWFRQLAYYMGDYCSNIDYPEPSVIVVRREGEFYVQKYPHFGDKDSTVRVPRESLEGYELVFYIHGHPVGKQKKYIYPSPDDIQLTAVLGGINVQIDIRGVTISRGRLNFFDNLRRYLEEKNLTSSILGHHQFLNPVFLSPPRDNTRIRKKRAHLLVKHLGIEALRLEFGSRFGSSWKSCRWIHCPAPLDSESAEKAEEFKKRFFEYYGELRLWE